MPNQDAGYKLIFSNPTLVQELLRSGLCGSWPANDVVPDVEKIPGSLVDERLLVRRENDVVWLCRDASSSSSGVQQMTQVILLIEFQSSTDQMMPVRLASYISLLYEEICRTRALSTQKLPRALPLIFYHGLPRWSGPVELKEALENDPEELDPHQLHLCPILIDQLHLEESRLPSEDNLVGLLLRIERSRDPQTAINWIRKMNERLVDRNEINLHRSMTQWLIHYYLPTRMSELDFEKCQTLNQIAMTIENNTLDWSVPIREEGIKIGIEKGTLTVLLKMLTRRFGSLPESLVDSIENAGIGTLEKLADVALDLESIEQIESILNNS